MNELTQKKFKYQYKAYIFYALTYLLMVLLGNIGKNGEPYSFALYAALLIMGYNIPLLLIIFNLSFVTVFSLQTLICMGIMSACLALPFIIYRIAGKKPKGESFVFVAASLLYYLFNGPHHTLMQRGIISAVIMVFSFICIAALTAATKKLLKCRLKTDELICCAAFAAAACMGLLNLVGTDIYKAICLYTILLACFTIKNSGGMFIACNLAIPLAVSNMGFEYVGLFTVYAFVILCFCKYSRLLSICAALLAEVIAAYYFEIYGGYSYYSLIALAAACALFMLTPKKLTDLLEKKFVVYKERHLTRAAINRNRTMLSNKLYEISNVFKELESVFDNVKSALISEDTALKCVMHEVESRVCPECENFSRCNREQVASGLFKLTRIGLAKGKVNVIDIPSDISSNCAKPNNMLYAINRMLTDYRNHIIEAKNNDMGRDMIARQAGGVGEILKGLALEAGKTLGFESKLENRFSQTLLNAGVVPSELLIYGDGDDLTVSLVCEPTVPPKLFSDILFDLTGKKMTVSEKSIIAENKCSYLLKSMPPMDAVFGVAMAAKKGSDKSGDTYSVIRISEHKFLVALSDGMGSGSGAEKLSNAAISLIEGFFKVGMPTDLVLSTVNMVLNFNREDNYACLDIAMIDLQSGETGIIKIGSPFGFIIRNDEIKILENDSLPIGILDRLTPNTSTEQLESGDLLLLLSDGISLAFGSSTDMFEYIKNCPSKNPQSLCDSILNEAVRLYGGTAEDDMTVLATRIFDKSA